MLVLATSCSPLGIIEEIEGPTIALTAESPRARFSLELCMEGTDDHSYWTEARVRAQITRTGGAATTTTRAHADSGDARGLTQGPGEQGSLFVMLDAEGPWEDGTQRRCGRVQEVEFSTRGADEGASITVEWDASFAVEYHELGLCKERVDPKITIEIEPLPPDEGAGH